MAEIIRREDIFNGTRIVKRPVIKCCGQELVCQLNTNTCGECGADYNMSGSRLADRSQWGQETGEHPVDVLNGMDDYNYDVES